MNSGSIFPLKKKRWAPTRWIIVIGVWALCYVLFPILTPKFGETAGAIFGVGMIFTGWFFGVIGCFYGIWVIVIFLILLRPADQVFVQYMTQFLPGILVAAFTGVTTGWVKKLFQESKEQATELEFEKKALVEQNALRQQAEQALQELNAELETRVLERTKALESANAMLSQAMEERRVVLEHLHTSEERLRQLSETIDDMVWLIDIKSSVLLYVSPACRQIFGLSQKDFERDPWAWLGTLHPDDRERIVDMLRKYNHAQNPFDLEFRVLGRDDSIKWVWARAFPIRDDQDEIYRMAGVMKDITARKLAEEQIQDSLREKEVLLKEVHHRVKNNLQVISSLLNLAAVHIAEPESRQVFKESQNRIHSMALIHEKLYRSQDLARINFKEYIENFTNYLFYSYQKENSGIALQLDVQEVFLNIDTAIPLGLILSELVSNALKYAFPSGKAGEIKVHFSQKSKKEYCLEVIDTGIGLEFDSNTLPTNSLGLVLVNSLVEQLDGVIEIDCHPGARFSITFPT